MGRLNSITPRRVLVHGHISRRDWIRFIQKVFEDGCWHWLSSRQNDGYGQFGYGGKLVTAHRFAYIALREDIPALLECDHLCRNRGCVNPFHLELVTHKENTLRGNTLVARNAQKAQCPYGHAYNERNTYIHTARNGDKRRYCRDCHNRRTSGSYRTRRNNNKYSA